MSAFYQIVVVGAGPGGIAAATIAAEAGLRVALIDDNVAPGGQIWRGILRPQNRNASHSSSYWHWTERLRSTACDVLSGWQVIAKTGEKELLIECAGISRTVSFEHLILATGARERYLPFPGWTLPGVLGAGGVQALCKAGFVPKGRTAVVSGTGPLLFPVAAGLKKNGARLKGIFEQTSLSNLIGFAPSLAQHPAKIWEGVVYKMQTLSAAYKTGCWVRRAEGDGKLEQVVVTNGRKEWTIACDLLACGYHLVPNLELPTMMECAIEDGFVRVDSLQQSSASGIYCVGELTGIGGLDKAIVEGRIAALAALGQQEKASVLHAQQRSQIKFAQQMESAFRLRPELKGLVEDETIICRCEDIRYKELRPESDWRAAKLESRCGMGACQGRTCGPATEFLFDWKRTSVRPPLFPATLGALAKPGEEK